MHMSIKDLSCSLHITEKALEGDTVYGLPEGNTAPAYNVDNYPACPANWMHGSDKASSYFVAAEPGKGAWINFNNCSNHKHHVAIVLSIQGINPITMQKTNVLRLEQYKHKCPVHDVEFRSERYCPECEFKWPAQNYIASTTTPRGFLWIDGFYCPDGTVRQYLFTEEEIRGIASQIIGDDRVFAIGIAFYLSKEPKPIPSFPIPRTMHRTNTDWQHRPVYDNFKYEYGSDNITVNNISEVERSSIMRSLSSPSSDKFNKLRGKLYTSSVSESTSESDSSSSDDNLMESVDLTTDTVEIKTSTKLEIGAGAKIKQKIYDDTNDLLFWKDEPEGMIYINYASVNDVSKILHGGLRKDKTNGFMNGLKIGN